MGLQYLQVWLLWPRPNYSPAKSVNDGTGAVIRNVTLRTANVRVSTMPTELSDAPYAAELPFSLRERIISVRCPGLHE